jgi:hypothetical protein
VKKALAAVLPVFLCAVYAAAQAIPNRITAPIDDGQLVVLGSNVHPLAQARFDRGAAPVSTPTGRVRLALQRSAAQQQALTQFLSEVQNPGSPVYHHWLTPAQYGAQFGISDADLARVTGWLQSHGFRIEKIPASRNVIEFSGNFDQVQSAFHTAIHEFSVNGETHLANVADPQIPAALAPVVSGVGPLNDFRPRPMIALGPRGRFDPSTGRIEPELTLKGGSTFYLFVDPADAATIYDTPNKALNTGYTGSTAYDGSGVNLGIVGDSDLVTQDVANYREAFLGEAPSAVNLPTVVVDGSAPGINGAAVEALLDNEVAGGIAPKANIYFYTSADTALSSGLFNAMFRAVDDNVVSIISISFGQCEAGLRTQGNQLLLEWMEQAAAQGITVTVSAGDNGSAGCDDFNTQSAASQGFAVSGFASTPYNIAVGGTDYDVLSTSFATYVNTTSSGTPPYFETALKYIPEKPWNDSTTVNTTYQKNVAYKGAGGSGGNIIAGSGGVSTVYPKPSFQTSLTPGDGARDLPDVSFLSGNLFYNAAWVICGDNTAYGITTTYFSDCQTSNGQFTTSTTFGGAGGTSAAAPAFAAMMALVAQAHGSPADNYRLGQADNVLYLLAKSKYATVFHDVTDGNNSVACSPGSPNCGASNSFLTGYNAGTGYDLATGLGSVDVAAMVANWASVLPAATTTSLKINGSTASYTGVHGAGLKFDVSVTPTTATGVAGLVDNANEMAGGNQNNGQLPVPLTSGAGSATYNGLPGGSYTVWARYGGDASHASSTSTPPINVTITPEASTTILSAQAYDRSTGQPISSTNMPLGSYVFLDAQIEGTAEGANTQGVATGTVTFTDGNPTIGIGAVNSANQASWPPLNGNLPALTGGQHQLVASYSGDPSYKASSSSVSVSVLQGPSQIVVNSQGIPALTLSSSQAGWVYANVITDLFNGVPPPTGTASLMKNNTVVSSQGIGGGDGGSTWTINANIPIQASQLQPGLNTFTVQYSGDSNYLPSSGGPVSIDAIAPGGGVALTSPDTVSISAGGTLTSAITLTPSGGYTGLTQWNCSVPTDTNLFVCLVPTTHVPLSGPADSVLAVFAASSASGNYTLTLTGNDGTTDGIAISKNITVTVAAAPPALAVIKNGLLNVAAGSTTGNVSAFSIIPSGGLTGQVNLSCAVTTSMANPQSTPTCTVPSSVTFTDATPAMAQVKVGTTSPTTAGSYSVTITATSASNSAVSATGNVPLTVTASPSFSLSTTGIVNISAGSTSSNAATLTITPLNGFSGPVNVACLVEAAFLAAGGNIPTCTVPSSVTLTAGTPAAVNVSLSAPVQNFGGFYLMTLSVVDTNSAQLGFDATVDVIMTVAPSFSLSNSGNMIVSAGATTGNTATVTLNPLNGFTGNVNISCKVSTSIVSPNDPPGCSLSPAQVSVTGSAAVTSKLSVTTTAPTTGAVAPQARPFRLGTSIPVLALALLFGIGSKRKKWMRLVGALVLGLWLGAAGCGGGSGSGGGGGGGGNPGTTPGNYTVVVTGTDTATGNITAQTSVTLTVN